MQNPDPTPNQQTGPKTDPKDPRRHDLDALRAFAMVLGILLHGALAYTQVPWIVQDAQKSVVFDHLFEFIHTFRMPIFFLLSGFFTAMLWRRRGTRGLLRHRTFRILFPLLACMATIVPATMWSIQYANRVQSSEETEQAVDAEELDIWRAAAEGSLPQLRARINEGADLNAPDPNFRTTPLGYAVLYNQTEIVQELLTNGANPNIQFGDGGTALHSAMFLGRSEIASTLLDNNADLELQNMRGETPTTALAVNEQITMMITGFLQIEDDFESIQSGREEIRTLLDERGKPIVAPTTSERIRNLINLLIALPVFYHLWFLWHLCWFVVIFVVLALVTKPVSKFKGLSLLTAFPWCLVYLVPLTMWTQSLMALRMGPDTAIGLIPAPHVLGHYAVFFFFGSLLFGVFGSSLRVGWWGVPALVGSVVCYPLALSLDESGSGNALGWFGLVQSVMVWLMIYGLIGLFELIASAERRWVRFLSDSSYWLYIAHLPLIVVVQVWVLNWDAPSWMKFAVVTLSVFVVLLVSYRYLIRYSPIGTMLNGKRQRPVNE
ncbi:MAG: acyltransferase family protein [Phycisphaerales bacterium]|nr:acyltransferase family protein [Phycisphaerales bacterium]